MRMLAVKRSPRASLRDVPLTRRTDPDPSMTGCMVGSATRSNSCWAGAPIRRLADTEVGVDEVAADGSPAVGGAEARWSWRTTIRGARCGGAARRTRAVRGVQPPAFRRRSARGTGGAGGTRRTGTAAAAGPRRSPGPGPTRRRSTRRPCPEWSRTAPRPCPRSSWSARTGGTDHDPHAAPCSESPSPWAKASSPALVEP